MFLIMFKTGQALLLPPGRIWSPRHGRETGAEQPRNVTGSWPQTRPFHDCGLAADSLSPWPLPVRGLSKPLRCRERGLFADVPVCAD